MYKAVLDQFSLDVEFVDDRHEKALAVYEYPLRNGADLDDMGMRARVVRFRAYWYDDTYEAHEFFVEHVRTTLENEFVHPVYGSMFGRCRSVSVRKDERTSTAEVEVEFVEQMRGDREPRFEERIGTAVEGAYSDCITEMIDEFSADVKAAVGAESATLLGAEITSGSSMVSQLSGISWRARQYVKSLDTAVNTMDAALSTVSNPATSILTTIEFASNMPGRVIGSVARCVERYAESVAGIVTAPSRFMDSYRDGIAELKESMDSLSKLVDIGAAQYGAMRVGYLYEDDESSRERLRRQEQTEVWDAAGNLVIDEAAPEVLTVGELESSLADTREFIQEAIDQARLVPSLKTMARALLRHVRTIKLERERIETVTVSGPISLHALCHRRGLPIAYAERIWSINEISNPAFVEGEVDVYV